VKRRISHHGKNLVSNNLRRLRHAKGWSQQDLAVQCQLRDWDTTRDIISKIEYQRRNVTDLELAAFAKIFRVSADELIGLKALPKTEEKLTAHLNDR